MKKYLLLLCCCFLCLVSCGNQPIINPEQIVNIGETAKIEFEDTVLKDISFRVNSWEESQDLKYVNFEQLDYNDIAHTEDGKITDPNVHYLYVSLTVKNIADTDRECNLMSFSVLNMEDNIPTADIDLEAFDKSQHPNDTHDYGKYLLPAGAEETFQIAYLINTQEKGEKYIEINLNGISHDDSRAKQTIRFVPLT